MLDRERACKKLARQSRSSTPFMTPRRRAVSHSRLRSEVVDLQSKSVVPRATSTHQYTARGSQIAALKGRVSSSLAVCLGAKTDEVPTSTFWTLSGILVSGA